MASQEAPFPEELLPFRIDVRPEGDRVVVAPVGELDMSVGDALGDEVRQVAADGASEVVLDLRGLTFMDSCGLRVLLDLHRDLGPERFGLIDGAPAVARLLDLTGTREHLRFVS